MFRLFRLVFLIVFFAVSMFASSQQNESLGLEQKILKNKRLLIDDSSSAFKNLEILLEEAKKSKNHKAELELMSQSYNYYYFVQSDFEQMLNESQRLLKKSIDYDDKVYEAIAHKYIAQTYLFNGLYDRTESELNAALEALKEENGSSPAVIQEKAKIYTAFSNLFTQRNEYFKSTEYLKLALSEHKKLKDKEQVRGTSFMDYANLAGAFLKINRDSAEFYALKSNALRKPEEYNHELTFLNYLVLGKVYQERKNYDKAFEYFREAEKIKENKNFLNVQELYKSYISLYTELNDNGNKKLYEDKLKSNELSISENKNKSLQKLLKEEHIKNSDSDAHSYKILLFGLILALIGILFYTYWKRKKMNNSLSKPESKAEIQQLTPGRYEELIKLSAENSHAFILAFDQDFPGFSKKLLEINSDLTNDEIELLAMVKLNLSSKEISSLKFIQPKTVQNRRHRARKKLGLSTSENLYKWIENF